MPCHDVGELDGECVFGDSDLAFENKHRREPYRGVSEPIRLADLLQTRRVGGAEHDDHIDVRGLPQPPLCGRAEQHDREEITAEYALCRRGKGGERPMHGLRELGGYHRGVGAAPRRCP
jgi:hypothetical protein